MFFLCKSTPLIHFFFSIFLCEISISKYENGSNLYVIEKDMDLLDDSHREILNSVQGFIKVKSWLLLIFTICLGNHLKFHNYIEFYKVL